MPILTAVHSQEQGWGAGYRVDRTRLGRSVHDFLFIGDR
jgi:hypothetical protein